MLVGCSTLERDQLKKYREVFATGDYEKANTLLDKSVLKKNSRDKLLWYMEKGTTAFALGNYGEAIELFNAAEDLVDVLYTKKVGQKIAIYIVNDNAEDFYGAAFERSWLYYYLARSYYQVYQQKFIDIADKDKRIRRDLSDEEARKNLFSARAQMLAWDTFFQELQRSTDGKTFYQHDLVAKVFAAQIHEVTTIRADLQISLQLYKDALNLFNKWGKTFTVFNQKSQEYSAKVKDALAEGKTPANLPVEELPQTNITEVFLKTKILELTQSLRPTDVASVMSSLQLSSDEKKYWAQNNQKSNLTIILEEGLVPEKKAELVSLGLRGACAKIQDPTTRDLVTRIGVDILAAFAMEKLGLAPNNIAYGNFVMARSVTAIAVSEAAIEFEVPSIRLGPTPDVHKLVLKNAKGEVVKKIDWALIGSVGDVAKQVLEEESGFRIMRTGVRVAVKQIAAIASAFLVYQGMDRGNKDPRGSTNFLAKAAAMATYIGASKGIAASERADVRHWTTLPDYVFIEDVQLAPGTYTVALNKKVDGVGQEVERILGQVTVPSSGKSIFSYRMP